MNYWPRRAEKKKRERRHVSSSNSSAADSPSQGPNKRAETHGPSPGSVRRGSPSIAEQIGLSPTASEQEAGAPSPLTRLAQTYTTVPQNVPEPPQGWAWAWSESGKKFYYYQINNPNVTQWEFPERPVASEAAESSGAAEVPGTFQSPGQDNTGSPLHKQALPPFQWTKERIDSVHSKHKLESNNWAWMTDVCYDDLDTIEREKRTNDYFTIGLVAKPRPSISKPELNYTENFIRSECELDKLRAALGFAEFSVNITKIVVFNIGMTVSPAIRQIHLRMVDEIAKAVTRAQGRNTFNVYYQDNDRNLPTTTIKPITYTHSAWQRDENRLDGLCERDPSCTYRITRVRDPEGFKLVDCETLVFIPNRRNPWREILGHVLEWNNGKKGPAGIICHPFGYSTSGNNRDKNSISLFGMTEYQGYKRQPWLEEECSPIKDRQGNYEHSLGPLFIYLKEKNAGWAKEPEVQYFY